MECNERELVELESAGDESENVRIFSLKAETKKQEKKRNEKKNNKYKRKKEQSQQAENVHTAVWRDKRIYKLSSVGGGKANTDSACHMQRKLYLFVVELSLE